MTIEFGSTVRIAGAYPPVRGIVVATHDDSTVDVAVKGWGTFKYGTDSLIPLGSAITHDDVQELGRIMGELAAKNAKLRNEVKSLAGQLSLMQFEDSGLAERHDYWKGSNGAYALCERRLREMLK